MFEGTKITGLDIVGPTFAEPVFTSGPVPPVVKGERRIVDNLTWVVGTEDGWVVMSMDKEALEEFCRLYKLDPKIIIEEETRVSKWIRGELNEARPV